MNIRANSLIILISIIITIIIFAFVFQRSIEINKVYSDSIHVDILNNYDFKIAQFKVKNNKFFPVGLNLTDLKACIFNDKFKFTYEVYYTLSKKNYKVKYNHYETQNYIDINSLSNQIIDVRAALEYPQIGAGGFEKNLYGNLILSEDILYLFDQSNVTIYHHFPEFCDNVKIWDAVRSIKIIGK